MKPHPVFLAVLGAAGFLFLGAETTYNNGDPPYGHPAGIRPHPVTNEEVLAIGGYIVITTPAGEYITDRRDVMSLSAHNYQLPGGMRVWEVTVSERSSNTVRFYYTRPVETAKTKAGDASDESEGGKLDRYKGSEGKPAADDPSTRESRLKMPVRKEYPATTHAHCIEFRIDTLEKLDDLYAYLTLMVYGWSPMKERPREARRLRVHRVLPIWDDWKNADTN